jgi:hypothetical protein
VCGVSFLLCGWVLHKATQFLFSCLRLDFLLADLAQAYKSGGENSGKWLKLVSVRHSKDPWHHRSLKAGNSCRRLISVVDKRGKLLIKAVFCLIQGSELKQELHSKLLILQIFFASRIKTI